MPKFPYFLHCTFVSTMIISIIKTILCVVAAAAAASVVVVVVVVGVIVIVDFFSLPALSKRLFPLTL